MKALSLVLRILADLLLLAALAGMGWWLGTTFAGRVGYPFDLEWMEGGMLLHALRVRDGLPLYVAPTPEFIPYIYPPGYPWLVGMLGRFVELGYPLARWVSLVGSVLAALTLVWAVRQEGHRWSLGLGAAALFISCYEQVGAFFDMVRTDGQQLFLMALALVLCRRATRPFLAVGGLALMAAFTTKHNMAMLGVPIAIALWRVYGWRRAAWFGAWSAGPALAWTAYMQLSSDGYFLTYILAIPATHPIVGSRAFPQAEIELVSAFPWALGLATAPVVLLLAQRLWRRWKRLPPAAPATADPAARYRRWYWTGVVIAGVIMVVLMRGHHGGFMNVLMPGFWLMALVAAFGMGALVRRWSHPLASSALLLACAGVVAFQCWDGRWDRDRYQPTQADLDAGQRVLDTIASYDGPVLMPHSPYYLVLAGKEPCFALIALWDINHKLSPLKKEARTVNRAIKQQRYDAVILASKKFEFGLKQAYEHADTIKYKGKTFYPKTGWRARPRHVFEPIEDPGDEPTPEATEATEATDEESDARAG